MFYVRIIIIIVMQLQNTNAAACVEHVSIQATGQSVYANISIAAVVRVPKNLISSWDSRSANYLLYSCFFNYLKTYIYFHSD